MVLIFVNFQDFNFSFYRAMLCTARTMPSQDVYLSVRLSVTHRYFVEIHTRIFSHIIYRTATSSMTLNDHKPRFKIYAIV